jgi:ATP-dependent Clp protease adaptor protein ClpS
MPAVDEQVEEITGGDVDKDTTPLWNVVLLDDDDHSYEYVIEMLCRLFFIPPERAYQHAVEVDSTGRTIVFSGDEEMALFGKRQIESYGADPRMARSRGSMSALVEKAS